MEFCRVDFMKYHRPDIGNNTLAYKGRRYWVIELAQDGKFDFVTKELGDYVLWDCLFNGVLATIKNTKGGGVVGSLMSHVELSYSFRNIEDAAKTLPTYYEGYIKHIT
jgi:hypothetical protein